MSSKKTMKSSTKSMKSSTKSMKSSAKSMNFSGNETYWLNLVKDIYNNRESCPHRQSLKKVLKDATPLYCAVDPESKISTKSTHAVSHHSNFGTRSFRSNGTPSSASGFTGNESGWLHLVKNILRNSDCKFHGRLKDVLKKASKVYCKHPKTLKKSRTLKKTNTGIFSIFSS